MTFERYLRLSSTLMILTGFYSILIAGDYAIPVWAGILATLAYWLWGDRLTDKLRIPRSIWNGIAILLFAYLFYDTFFGGQDLVGNGVKFVIYLQVVKLLSPKTNRDHLQIYLLSFLHLLASTVISSDLSFAFTFLLYVVLATWSLALFNLKRKQEETAPEERRPYILRSLLQSTDMITPRFLGMTSLLSLVIIVFTLLVFYSFPRLSMGQFLKRVSTRQHVSGFSENVELGTIGNIKTNDTVTMRVEISKDQMGKIDLEHLYWRGTAADFFDGRRWKQSMPERKRVNIDIDTGVLNTERSAFSGGQTLQYKVFLEAMSTPMIFGADRLFRVTWDKPFIERFFRGVMMLEVDSYVGFHFLNAENFLSDLSYTAESVIGTPEADILKKENEEPSSYTQSYYLQLPELRPEVLKLLQSIPTPDTSMYDMAVAIQKYIEKNYRYTLEVQDVGVDDPLKFFLLDRKMGHCEYFSTALVIALRVHGIPARQAVGFRGGELNPYGGYLAVRQSDAHTWVEVYFPRSGWTVFDPSPPDSTIRLKGKRFQKLYQMLDYLRLRWNKYIVEYDLRTQASILEKVGREIARLTRGMTHRDDTEREKTLISLNQKETWNRVGKNMVLPVLLLAGIGWFFFRRRNRSTGKYAEVEEILAPYGYHRAPGETPEEFMRIVQEREGPLPVLKQLTHWHYESRYGGRPLHKEKWTTRLTTLKQSLATKRQRLKKAA